MNVASGNVHLRKATTYQVPGFVSLLISHALRSPVYRYRLFSELGTTKENPPGFGLGHRPCHYHSRFGSNIEEVIFRSVPSLLLRPHRLSLSLNRSSPNLLSTLYMNQNNSPLLYASPPEIKNQQSEKNIELINRFLSLSPQTHNCLTQCDTIILWFTETTRAVSPSSILRGTSFVCIPLH